MTDTELLEQLNREITKAEIEGDVAGLARVLAPRLAFQRADPAKTVDDQVAFLQKAPERSGERTLDRFDAVEIHGNRAIVKCIITQKGISYHNIRLFVRRDDGWKLLAWANEAVKAGT